MAFVFFFGKLTRGSPTVRPSIVPGGISDGELIPLKTHRWTLPWNHQLSCDLSALVFCVVLPAEIWHHYKPVKQSRILYFTCLENPPMLVKCPIIKKINNSSVRPGLQLKLHLAMMWGHCHRLNSSFLFDKFQRTINFCSTLVFKRKEIWKCFVKVLPYLCLTASHWIDSLSTVWDLLKPVPYLFQC